MEGGGQHAGRMSEVVVVRVSFGAAAAPVSEAEAAGPQDGANFLTFWLGLKKIERSAFF